MPVPTPALNALTAAEKAELLDELLDAQPALRERAEQLAVQGLSRVDPAAVADDVEFDLCSADIEQLNGRAGYQPGIGYVHPVEAADDILDELLQPYLDNLRRHAKLGMTAAAVDLAVGILHGLHRLRGSSSGTLLECSPGLRRRARREGHSAMRRDGGRATRRRRHRCPVGLGAADPALWWAAGGGSRR